MACSRILLKIVFLSFGPMFAAADREPVQLAVITPDGTLTTPVDTAIDKQKSVKTEGVDTNIADHDDKSAPVKTVPETDQPKFVEKEGLVTKVDWKSAGAEFVAMTLFVIIGCGSAMGIAKEPGSAWVLQVSLTFGLAITALAYALGHYSGAHINCAVTFGLVLAQQVCVVQGLVIFVAQMLGAVLGALILLTMHLPEDDKTGGIGCNGISKGCTQMGALVGEVMMTFLLMFVVLETAVNPVTVANRMVAPLAIGLAVFLAHSVLIPIDGCSINPTRSFGPAFVGSFIRSPAVEDAWKDMWVFWVGPLAGAAAAVGVHKLFAM